MNNTMNFSNYSVWTDNRIWVVDNKYTKFNKAFPAYTFIYDYDEKVLYLLNHKVGRLENLASVSAYLIIIASGSLYQGVIDCSTNPNYPAGNKDYYWRVSVAGLIGGGAGVEVEIGDEIICIADSIGGTEAAVGTSYMLIQKNLQACTVAELQTGTSQAEYLTPWVLSGALNAGATPFSVATIMTLSGGTTNQLTITVAGAQDGMYIAGTTTGRGINISAPTTTGITIGGASTTGIALSAATTAIDINSDETLISNARQMMLGSRDLVGAIVADRTVTAYAVDLTQRIDNQTAGDFDILNTGGLLSLYSTHTVTPSGGVKTGTDTYSSTTMFIGNVAETAASADAILLASPMALDIGYTVIVGAGSTMDLTNTNISRITATIPTGTTSGGGFYIKMLSMEGTSVLNDANMSFMGLNVDFTSITNTSTAALRGVNVAMPTVYTAATESAIYATGDGMIASILSDGVAESLVLDTTDANNAYRGLDISRDITLSAAATGVHTITESALYVTSTLVNNNDDVGGYNITATDTFAFISRLHSMDTTAASTDEISGNVLRVQSGSSLRQATDTANVTSTAISVIYSLDPSAGTLNYNATDVINIDWDVAANTVLNGAATVGAIISGMRIDANGFVPGATAGAATIVTGHLVDWTDAIINDANVSMYGYKAIMPYSNDNTTNAINSAYMAVLSSNEAIPSNGIGYTAWDIHTNTAVATDTTTTMLANFTSVLTANQGGGAAVVTRSTNPVINMSITSDATGAADIVNVTSGFITMAAAISGAGTNAIYGNMVSLTVAGTTDAQVFRGFYLNADNTLLTTSEFYGIDIDASGVTNTASTACYGARIRVPATADAGLYTDGYIENIKNAGTAAAGTVTVREYGDGKHHITVITLAAHPIGSVVAANSKMIGSLVYTMPAGVHTHFTTYYSVGISNSGGADGTTPVVAVGSVIGDSSVVAVINATLPAANDYTAESATADVNGTPEVVGPLGATLGVLTDISLNTAAMAKTVHFNAAGAWGVTGNITATGTIVLVWDSMV